MILSRWINRDIVCAVYRGPISWQTLVWLTFIWDVPPSCPAAQSAMGDYCAPARGTMEIMHPEGHIMEPEGGIMFPEGLHSFHWPEGRAQ